MAQCDDRFAIGQRNVDTFRPSFAISDGATDAYDSGRWASLLAEEYVRRPVRQINEPWLTNVAERFRSTINLAELPWYVQERAGQGSFGTLTAVSINLRARLCNVLSIGDSIAVIKPAAGRPVVFPHDFANAEHFSSRPLLLPSNPQYLDRVLICQPKRLIRLMPGRTEILLMTDALGHWFARAAAGDCDPWKRLAMINEQPEFEDFVEGARDARLMRNDDVTLLKIAVTIR